MVYHVLSRANARIRVFDSSADYALFESDAVRVCANRGR